MFHVIDIFSFFYTHAVKMLAFLSEPIFLMHFFYFSAIHSYVFCNNLILTIYLYANQFYALFFQLFTFESMFSFIKTSKQLKHQKLIADEIN